MLSQNVQLCCVTAGTISRKDAISQILSEMLLALRKSPLSMYAFKTQPKSEAPVSV